MLNECALFRGLAPEQIRAALDFFAAQEKSCARGDLLKDALSPLSAFGLVLSGAVSVSMDSVDGRALLLNLVAPGQTFGESLCYLQTVSPIRIAAAQDARVLWLKCEGLRRAPLTPLEGEMQRRFTAMLAARTLRMNDRIQILCRGGIREKLKAFFAECVRDAGGRTSFTVPFDRAALAAYLAVDRSALSRELSRLRREGAIAFHKNHFQLFF